MGLRFGWGWIGIWRLFRAAMMGMSGFGVTGFWKIERADGFQAQELNRRYNRRCAMKISLLCMCLYEVSTCDAFWLCRQTRKT